MYESNYPTNGFACSLTALGGDPKSGRPERHGRAAHPARPGLGPEVRIHLHHYQLHQDQHRRHRPHHRLHASPPFLRRWDRPATAHTAPTSRGSSSSIPRAAPTAPRPWGNEPARNHPGAAACLIMAAALVYRCRLPASKPAGPRRTPMPTRSPSASTSTTTSCIRSRPALRRAMPAWACTARRAARFC